MSWLANGIRACSPNKLRIRPPVSQSDVTGSDFARRPTDGRTVIPARPIFATESCNDRNVTVLSLCGRRRNAAAVACSPDAEPKSGDGIR
jgi:hypothetical protein